MRGSNRNNTFVGDPEVSKIKKNLGSFYDSDVENLKEEK